MTDDPDAPETFLEYVKRHARTWPENWTGQDIIDEVNSLWKPVWRDEEREKAQRRKARAIKDREAKQLDQQIQRVKEREQREATRKRERQEEQERRDPTPFFNPPDFEIHIPYSIRDRHIYIPGGTRRGKSTQLQNIIMHDIMQGNGVAVLDPKRHLLRSIVHALPAQRVVDGETRNIVDDIVYLDLKTPIPINLMDRTTDNIDRVVNDIIYIVTKGDPNLSAAEPLLDRTIRTLVLIPDATLTDAYRFLTQKSARRKELLDKLEAIDPDIHATWDPFPKDGVAALERRLAPFYWNKSLKAIFDAHTAPLDFDEIMDNKKILLVDLSPPGERDTSFYGSLIMSQIMSATMRRARLTTHRCVPFFLHVDEFEFFQTESFARILSVAGGLGLRLTIGNQYLDQVLSSNLAAILGNNPTFIFFQISQKDAGNFDAVVAPYKSTRLVQLEPYQACFKIGSTAPVFKLTKLQYSMTKQDEDDAELMLDKLRDITVERYRQRITAPSATTGQNRSGDSGSSNSPENPHDKGDGIIHPTGER